MGRVPGVETPGSTSMPLRGTLQRRDSPLPSVPSEPAPRLRYPALRLHTIPELNSSGGDMIRKASPPCPAGRRSVRCLPTWSPRGPGGDRSDRMGLPRRVWQWGRGGVRGDESSGSTRARTAGPSWVPAGGGNQGWAIRCWRSTRRRVAG